MNLRVYTLNCRGGLNPVIKNDLLHGAFKVRYQVYHDEMGIVPSNPEEEICDEQDFTESTAIFLSLDGKNPAGTIRLSMNMNPEITKMPEPDDLIKKAGNTRNIGRKTAAGWKPAEVSRFTVLKEYRNRSTCVPSILTCMMYDRCINEGITDLVIVANPSQSGLYKKAGFEIVGFKKDPLTGIESPAMHAEVRGGFGQFINYLKPILKKRGYEKIFDHADRIKQMVVNL